MDSKDNFLKKISVFVESIDEAYLIGISNKGIVKRAQKDLLKIESIKYEIKDSYIRFEFDDIVCYIEENINKYKCSCPSRSICKHIIMAYLHLLENKDEVFQLKDINQVKKDYLKIIEDFKIEEIKKKIGEKKLQNILNKIENGVNFEVNEGSIVEVILKDEDASVKLLGQSENYICSCKNKDFCTHKAEAIILYKLKKGFVTLEELKKFKPKAVEFDEERFKKASLKVQEEIEKILVTGLSRASITTLDRLNNLSIICHNYGLFNFEKTVRRIKEDFSLYFNKNASFIKEKLLNEITSLYSKAGFLYNSKDSNSLKQLVGEFKSSYYEIPPLVLSGFAAERWKSNSGYEGITYYFMDNISAHIYTYNDLMPTYYDEVQKKNWNSNSPWKLNCSICDLSSISFKLFYARSNFKRRLSSSSKSYGTIIDKISIYELNRDEITYNDWNSVLENIFMNEKKEENYNMIFLNVSKFGATMFKDVNGEFIVPIYDKNNGIINLSVKDSTRTKDMIRRIERIVKRQKSNCFFGRVYIENEELRFFPISCYDKIGKINNLTL
ncbi:SWIM zinc finger family protein [Clostridium felsineum]|uniref:SWIM zinc finger family protein n=1 Tax=Clostridium felsineum TaxID=36839 RepID=UPI00214D2821|nr:SWIM zinc finger family protein [Clostridium felsineum]MCR3759126.1 SWIM zinc finger family protein [Clostridium felsineum]